MDNVFAFFLLTGQLKYDRKRVGEGVMKGPQGGIFDLGTPELQLRHMSTRSPQGYIRKIEILKWLYSVFYQIKSVTDTSFLYVCIV